MDEHAQVSPTFLVAIEGGDGAGKHTAATNVARMLEAMGHKTALISFPRYGETSAAIALGEFLAGRTPVPVTPQAAAVLYALDRLESRPMVEAAEAEADIIVFDRYIASNIAYQAAKIPASEVDAMMRWIVRLETGMFALPAPQLSIYLDTPVEAAQRLMLLKSERSYTDRKYDEHEADLELQRRVRLNYRAMAEEGILGPWRIIAASEGDEMRKPDVIAGEIVDAIAEAMGGRMEKSTP